MSRSLIINIRASLNNPSKKELLYAANLLLKMPPVAPAIVRYTVLEDSHIIRSDKINGSIINSSIMYQLSNFDYNDCDLDVKDFLKRMS